MPLTTLPRALHPPEPDRLPTLAHVDLRLRDVREEMARAMIGFGLGRLDPADYATRARALKDEQARLEAARLRLGGRPWT